MTDTAPQIYSIPPGKTKVVSVDMSPQMGDGETLSGAVTVEEANTSALTIGTPTVNTATLTINDKDVAIGQALQFTVMGNVQGRYTISAFAVSSESQDIGGKVRVNIG